MVRSGGRKQEKEIGIVVLPKGKFQDEIIRTRPRGSGTNSADDGNATTGNVTCQPAKGVLVDNQNIFPHIIQ